MTEAICKGSWRIGTACGECLKCRDEARQMIPLLEEALRKVRTPFASTLNNHEALERLREINRLTYAVLGDGGL